MKNGFITLVELMIIATIISILAAIAVPLIIGNKNGNEKPIEQSAFGFSSIREVTYDGCQYIIANEGGSTAWCTHKGNCNNPIHQYKVEK